MVFNTTLYCTLCTQQGFIQIMEFNLDDLTRFYGSDNMVRNNMQR